MSTQPFHEGMGAFLGLHALGMIFFFVGLIFLITWGIKTLTPAKLWSWGLGLAIAGAILCALSMIAAPRLKVVSLNAGKMLPMEHGKMNIMFRKGSGADMGMTDHAMGGMMGQAGAMNMSMNDMSKMLEGKTGDAFDQAFLEGMIPHHQGAIDMAEEAMKSAKHAEIREMAVDIITAQQEEIDMMNAWLKEWGYTK